MSDFSLPDDDSDSDDGKFHIEVAKSKQFHDDVDNFESLGTYQVKDNA